MMNEVGAFRATDETLKTSEYVYRKNRRVQAIAHAANEADGGPDADAD
jgi:hypothetical protein